MSEDKPPEEKRRWKGPPKTAKADSGRGGEGKTQHAFRAKSESSKKWLERQLNDPYVRRAKADGWRARAAFKLLELDERFSLLRKGQRIVDLGAAPGGWAQVCVKTGAGRIVGIDLLPVEPLVGVTFLQKDFLDDDAGEQLMRLLGGAPELVLSDMAANTTGHTRTDQIKTGALADVAAHFAMDVLAPGGAFVTKAFQGGVDTSLLSDLKQAFATVRHAKPPASRQESSEVYLVAQGFKGRV
ncbi:MAG: RlmE family RNA methyltransferase [Caulobacterales bacterium]